MIGFFIVQENWKKKMYKWVCVYIYIHRGILQEKKKKKNSLKMNLFKEKKRKHKYYQDMITRTTTRTEYDSKKDN